MNEMQKTRPEPEPSRNLHPNEKQKTKENHVAFLSPFCELGFIARRSKSLKKRGTQRGILNTYMRGQKSERQKNRKTMWRFKFFFMIHLHSQNLPEAYSWMRGKKKNTAKTFQKPTPEWDTKKRETMWRFNCFLRINFHSQNLPEPCTSMRP